MKVSWFKDIRPVVGDPRRCRVCGNLTLSPVRRNANRLLLVVLGVLLTYIALDVAQDGRLDGSLYEAIHGGRTGADHAGR